MDRDNAVLARDRLKAKFKHAAANRLKQQRRAQRAAAAAKAALEKERRDVLDTLPLQLTAVNCGPKGGRPLAPQTTYKGALRANPQKPQGGET